ncbi:hypothetical protein QOT17_005468 [Balamuthia mandrillaris]
MKKIKRKSETDDRAEENVECPKKEGTTGPGLLVNVAQRHVTNISPCLMRAAPSPISIVSLCHSFLPSLSSLQSPGGKCHPAKSIFCFFLFWGSIAARNDGG